MDTAVAGAAFPAAHTQAAVAAAFPAGRTQAEAAAAFLPRRAVDIQEAAETSQFLPTVATPAEVVAIAATMEAITGATMAARTVADTDAPTAEAAMPMVVAGITPAASTKATATTTAAGFGLVLTSVLGLASRSATATITATGAVTMTDTATGYLLPAT